MPTYINLSWTQIENDTHTLADQLFQLNMPWKGIIAVARGGLVPATILAHRLSIHWIDTLCMSSYCDETQKQDQLDVLKQVTSNNQQLLVIDDLVDSGKTFELAREFLPNAHFSCIYAKDPGTQFTDSYALKVPSDSWLVFPWEESQE